MGEILKNILMISMEQWPIGMDLIVYVSMTLNLIIILNDNLNLSFSPSCIKCPLPVFRWYNYVIFTWEITWSSKKLLNVPRINEATHVAPN